MDDGKINSFRMDDSKAQLFGVDDVKVNLLRVDYSKTQIFGADNVKGNLLRVDDGQVHSLGVDAGGSHFTTSFSSDLDRSGGMVKVA